MGCLPEATRFMLLKAVQAYEHKGIRLLKLNQALHGKPHSRVRHHEQKQ